MTNEELVIRIKAGIDTAENMALLYEQNRSFIFKIAKRYSTHIEMDDLMQEAYIGLCDAVEHYEPEQAIKFLTYADYWIKQVMGRYQKTNSNTVRIPEHSHDRIVKYKKFVAMFYTKYNRNPTDAEISNHLGISREVASKLEKDIRMMELASLDSPIAGSEEGLCIGDSIAGPDNIEDEVIEEIYDKEFKEDLWNFVDDVLDDKEKQIIKYHFCDNRSRQSIGNEMGATREWIRQIEGKALRKLRRGAKSRAFKAKYETELGYAWRGSLSSFKTTWTSSTEQVAMRLMEL